MSGKLYICGTPIGNLEDASIRLLRILKQVDLIACEDTRHTLKLLNHFEIKQKLTSYHKHSRPEKEQYLLETMINGADVALVTDAGMPIISDPGENLVRKAIEVGVEVEVIPGPSAFTAALALSGLDGSTFVFAGFLPSRKSKRIEALRNLAEAKRTVILYEAPHRLLDTCQDIAEIWNQDAQLVVAREITKLYEEVRRGTAKELISYYNQNPPRGEICLLLPAPESKPAEIDMQKIVEETAELIRNGINKKEAFKIKAREYKIQKSTIYAQFLDK